MPRTTWWWKWPSNWGQHGAHHRHGHHRRPGARHDGKGYRNPIMMPVGQTVLGRVINVVGRARGRSGPGECQNHVSHSPSGPGLRGSGYHRQGPGDRRQGHRPAGAFPPGRQDGDVRRRRGGQDRGDDGDDPQHRHAARRHLGIRRRGGAHPGRQRPLPGDEALRGSAQGRA